MGPIICAYENPIYNVVHFTLWYHIWNQSLSPSVMNNCSHMCIRGWGSGCRVSWCHTNVILFYNSSRIIAAIFISVFMSVGPLFWKGRKRFGGRFLKHFLMIPVSFTKSCQKSFWPQLSPATYKKVMISRVPLLEPGQATLTLSFKHLKSSSVYQVS